MLACAAGGSLLGLAAAPAPSVGATPPSVRLLTPSPTTTVRPRRGGVPVTPAVFVAAVGGDFELRASRPRYGGRLSLTQVDSGTGAVVRSLPSRRASGWVGLRGFARVTVRDRRGRVVASDDVDFCPNGHRQRVNGNGPTIPRYPEGCSAFPFTRGAVWGIDNGWAASLSQEDTFDDYSGFAESSGFPGESSGRGSTLVVPSKKMPPGRYSVTVRIADEYARLLAVPAAAARVRVGITVKKTSPEPGRHRTRGGAAQQAMASTAARPRPRVAAPAPDPNTLPDLVALPGYSFKLSNRGGRSVLKFDTTSWNAGPGPLVVEGFRQRGRSVMDAYQYFHDATGNPLGSLPVGSMRYHPAGGHEHWHFLQFAQYSLLDASGRRRVRGGKQSFCLTPTDPVDLTVPRAEWRETPNELSSSCGEPSSIWIRETLPAGWGDTYPAELEGQSFDVTGLPNGRYHIRVEVNPRHGIRETTTANNVATRVIRLEGKRGKRRVRIYPWNGIRR